MLNFEINQFSGPLDLLLKLIEQEELDISQVALAEVTDQYLAYIDAQTDLSLDNLADFLVIASKLLIIKSKILLPKSIEEDDESADQLEIQLKMYKEYLEASKVMENILKNSNYCYTRERLPVDFIVKFSPPENFKIEVMSDVFKSILERIQYVTSLPEKIMEKVISLRETVASLRENLNCLKKFNFKEMVASGKTKGEKVVCFMALLELIKTGEALARQNDIFDEIEVEKI